MPDDLDTAALLAALDQTEAAGVPPHLVECLRALVRAEGWGWVEPRTRSSSLPVVTLGRGGMISFQNGAAIPIREWTMVSTDNVLRLEPESHRERMERLIREVRIGPR